MMVKYRAWIKNGWLDGGYKSFMEYDIQDASKNLYLKCFSDYLNCKDIEVMRFTGLKDTNCKDIYEGDIVKFNGQICSVFDELGSFSLVANNYIERPGWWNSLHIDNVIPLCEIAWNACAYEGWIEEVEVIGNIYENPKLLEAE